MPYQTSSRSHQKPRKLAKTIGQVLWDDLNFEREFYMIPRDTYSSIPAGEAARRCTICGVA